MSAPNEVRFVGPLDLLLYFRSMGMGGTVSNADLAALANEATEVFVRAGTVLLESDQPIETVYILVDGRLEIDAGSYKDVVEPPTGINWLRALGRFGTNRPVRALTDSVVLEIDASRMVELMERNPRIVELSLRSYAENIVRLREGLPLHPDNESPADPGSPPGHSLALVERLKQATGPGALWEHANLDAVLDLVWAMDEVEFKRGDVLWEAGARSPFIWRVVCGTVSCTNAAGRAVEVGAGFGLGVYDSLAGGPRSFRAVATGDGVALRASTDELLAVVEDHADMALSLLSVVCRALSDEYDADQLRRKATGAPPPPPIGLASPMYGAAQADADESASG